MELHLLVLDGEERIRAPLQLVGRAAARLAAAAPFVAEQHLGAVVVERRGVPERHVRIGDFVDADGVNRIADVEQQAETSARAAGQADIRIHRDVVALVRSPWRARRPAAAAAAPRPAPPGPRCRSSGRRLAILLIRRAALLIPRRDRQVLEDAGRTDNGRSYWGAQRHLG